MKCNSCDKNYNGKTERHLNFRINKPFCATPVLSITLNAVHFKLNGNDFPLSGINLSFKEARQKP